MNTLVQIALHPTKNQKHIAIITLDNPKALNALNLEMTQAIHQHLTDWRRDDTIAMVILHGTGDKAMCAGGDIKSLHSGDNTHARTFFEEEYGLMYTMHTYPKPIVAWGNGIVMGGGLGLLAASSHKVVTQHTLMAMPEVSIGLFPDAGGSYFLGQMMGKVGLFLGLTGARFTGVDAYYLGLADAVCMQDDFDDFVNVLLNSDWQDDNHNYHLLSHLLLKFHQSKLIKDSQILMNYDKINHLMNAGDLLAVDKALMSYQGDSEFIQSAIHHYNNGSATTKALTWQIYHTIKPLSLKEIFNMEMAVAVNCVQQGDFKEGVRALLIDKDKNPNWQYTTIKDIPNGFIDGFFNLG